VSLFVSSYRTGETTQGEASLAASCTLAQSIVPARTLEIERIELFLSAGAGLFLPVTLLLTAGDIWGANPANTIAATEIPAAALRPDSAVRCTLPCPRVVLTGGTTYYLVIRMPVAGAAGVLTTVGTPPAELAQGVSTRLPDGSAGDAVPGCVALELHDARYEPAAPGAAPVFRKAAETPGELGEQMLLSTLYPGDLHDRWLLDGCALPVNPSGIRLTEHTTQTEHTTLDARRIWVMEGAAETPRIVVGHTIELTFPAVGRDFVTWLAAYAEFGRPVTVWCRGILDPDPPEVAHMDDVYSDSPHFCRRYWGSVGHWCPDPATIGVWVDGQRADPSAYTVEAELGCIDFVHEQSPDATVQLSYRWQPRCYLTVEADWGVARGSFIARPKVILRELPF
jgi:hypothetical protein